jgi:hypothetical protein
LPLVGQTFPQGYSPAGWYPDPWAVGPFRWWNGWEWTPQLSEGGTGLPTSFSDAGRPWVKGVLITLGCISSGMAGLWVVMLPFLMLSDADNGRFDRDAGGWAILFVVLLANVAVPFVMLALERRRPPLWRVLLPVALSAGLVIFVGALLLPFGR